MRGNDREDSESVEEVVREETETGSPEVIGQKAGGPGHRKTDLIINAVRMIAIDGSTNIPTELCCSPEGKFSVGYKARSESQSYKDLFRGFKLNLGERFPDAKDQGTKLVTSSGGEMCARDLTSEFFRQIPGHASGVFAQQNLAMPQIALVSEPLRFKSQDDKEYEKWRDRYRRQIEKALVPTFFEDVKFVAEPFAVYQFYRYGDRNSLLLGPVKHVALVLDFGGGTFDVCILETTEEGDISKGGRHVKPLGSESEDKGGFFVDRMIAEDMFRKYCDSKGNIRKFKKSVE